MSLVTIDNRVESLVAIWRQQMQITGKKGVEYFCKPCIRITDIIFVIFYFHNIVKAIFANRLPLPSINWLHRYTSILYPLKVTIEVILLCELWLSANFAAHFSRLHMLYDTFHSLSDIITAFKSEWLEHIASNTGLAALVFLIVSIVDVHRMSTPIPSLHCRFSAPISFHIGQFCVHIFESIFYRLINNEADASYVESVRKQRTYSSRLKEAQCACGVTLEGFMTLRILQYYYDYLHIQ